MFINITPSETGDNKGSSGALVNYLEKENHLQLEKGRGLEQENWFNGSGTEIPRQEVRVRIDRNTRKLGRNESKFFLLNISPSQKEIAHLINRYGKHGAKEKLKEYAVKVMDEYARNFKRPGIESHKDLLWFGKLENFRYYKHTDKEVKNGTKQKGERKEGEQMHIQIIVSRKDITNAIKLSPENKSKGKNVAHSAKLGQFNRNAFKQSGEEVFDDFFDFDRGLKDTMKYANIMKNGTAQQKAQMHLLGDVTTHYSEQHHTINDLGNSVANGMFEGMGQMIASASNAGLGLLDILMTPVYDAPQITPDDESTIRRKKKKKGKSQSRGLGR